MNSCLQQHDTLSFAVTNTNVTEEETVKIFNVEEVLSGSSSGTVPVIIEEGAKSYTPAGGAVNGLEFSWGGSKDLFIDETNNILYSTTGLGIWIYDLNTETGSRIMPTTSVLGDPFPSGVCSSITKDIANNKIIVAIDNVGIWIYDVATNTGLVKDDTTATTGDKMKSKSIYSLAYDQNNEYLYVSLTQRNGFWQYKISTDTGKNFNAFDLTVTGTNIPNCSVHEVFVDSINGKLYVSCGGLVASGIWIYTPATNTGEFINALTSVSGDALPDKTVMITRKIENILYVGTNGEGIWVYDILLNTGTVYNTSTSVNGDILQSNDIESIYFYDNKIYAGTNYGIWIYDAITNVGRKIIRTTVIVGDSLPQNQVEAIYLNLNNNILYIASYSASNPVAYGGVWEFTPYSSTETETEYTTITNSDSTISYEEITRSIISEPILIYHIRLYTYDQNQIKKLFKYVEQSITGAEKTSLIPVMAYNSSKNTSGMIDIDIPGGMIIDPDKFFEYKLGPSTTVNMSFCYKPAGNQTIDIPHEVIPEILTTENEIKTTICKYNCNIWYFIIGITSIIYLLSKDKQNGQRKLSIKK